MNKLRLSVIGFLSVCAIFTTSYYFSYQHALNDFNKKSIQQDSGLIQQLDNRNLEPKPEHTTEAEENTIVVQDDYADLPVDASSESRVKPGTKYILETYNLSERTTLREELKPPAEFVGLNRDEIASFLTGYMQDMPLKEYADGLTGYELLSFSTQEFVIRKTYNKDLIPNKFYMAIRDGFVVIYYSDLKTVYEYTEIDALLLPEEERNALIQGFYVKDLEELYSILEGYTS